MLGGIRTALRWAYIVWMVLVAIWAGYRLSEGDEPGRVILGFLGLWLFGFVVWGIARLIIWPVSRDKGGS